MKRLWIGLILLALTLAAGIGLTLVFDSLYPPLADTLNAASAAAAEGDWEKADALAQKAKAHWETYRHFAASVTEHASLEAMDGFFARLQVLLARKNRDQFASVCAHLAQLATAIGESQSISWWNLL